MLKTCVLPELQTLEITETGLESTRMVHGGSFIKTESMSYPAVAVVGHGVLSGEEIVRESKVIALEGNVEGLELVDVHISHAAHKDLAVADTVVCIGRGLGSAEHLPMVEELADLMDAELGCTRPVAEEEGWMAKNRYIGISGVMLKSKTYLGLGVSGQMQHMIGTRSCSNIFAINKLDNAGVIDEADYTLIGNVVTAVPAIIEKLK